METYTAILPSLLTPKGEAPRMLIGISSAYRRVGLLHQKFRDHYGVDTPDILVIKGATAQFNQAADEAAIAAMRVADPTAHRSEWDSEFRDDLSGAFDEPAIDRAVNRGRALELPPLPGVIYYGFVDASGGAASGSGYSLCIGHKDKDGRFIIDVVKVRYGPFNPHRVTEEFAEVCKLYRVTRVSGDKYAKEWTQSAWRDAGLVFTEIDKVKSDLYAEAEPIFMQGLVELPPLEAMIREFRLLERDLGSGGKENIGPPRGVTDDMANAVCGCLRLLAKPGFSWDFVDAQDKDAQQQDDGGDGLAYARALVEKCEYLEARHDEKCRCYDCQYYLGRGRKSA